MEDVLLIAAAAVLLENTRQQVNLLERRRAKRIWKKKWLQELENESHYETIYVEWRHSDQERYRGILRLSVEAFDELTALVTPLIERRDTNMRLAIPAGKRLALTLRYLATGETYYSLSGAFCLGHSTVATIVPEVCVAIARALQTYTRCPSSEDEWKSVAAEYWERWDYAHCIGALDGKHVLIQPPPSSGSHYYNYKGQFSIVLMALVDADLRFIYADVRTNGRVSDGGVWGKCSLKRAIDENRIHLPGPQPLPGTDVVLPYHIVADEAFSLGKNLMRPYSGAEMQGALDRRIFNYRLSRARRTSENCFGVLVHRFEIDRAPLRTAPEKAVQIIMATIALHNWLRSNKIHRASYTPRDYIDHEDILTGQLHQGDWRMEQHPAGTRRLAHQGGNRIANEAKGMRDKICRFVNGPGSREWQKRSIL